MSTGPKSIKEAIANNKAAIDEHTKRLDFHTKWIGRLVSYESTVKKNVLGVADNKKLLEEMKIEEEKTFGNVKETKSLLGKHVDWTTDMFKRRKKWVQDYMKKNADRFALIKKTLIDYSKNFEILQNKLDKNDRKLKSNQLFIANFLADKYPDFQGKWEENEKQRKEKRSEELALTRKTIKISKF